MTLDWEGRGDYVRGMRTILFGLGLVLATVLGCGGSTVDHAVEPGGDPGGGVGVGGESAVPATGGAYGLDNGRRISDALVTGGQPDEETLRRAADAGVTTVISLRQPSEPGFEEERATVEELGMTFVSIPVAGEADLTQPKARAVHDALEEAGGQTILHCGTGNRAGALLALRAFHVEGQSADEALERGRSAGLTGLADAVREHLGEYCAENPETQQC